MHSVQRGDGTDKMEYKIEEKEKRKERDNQNSLS